MAMLSHDMVIKRKCILKWSSILAYSKLVRLSSVGTCTYDVYGDLCVLYRSAPFALVY